MNDKNQNVVPTSLHNVEPTSENSLNAQALVGSVNPVQPSQNTETAPKETAILEPVQIGQNTTQSLSALSNTSVLSNQENPVASPSVSEYANPKLTNADQVIAEIAPEKEAIPIFVVILFAMLLVFAFVLPTVSEKVTEYLNSKKTIPPASTPSQPGTQTPEDDAPEKVVVDLHADTTLEIGNVIISKFTFTTEDDGHYLSYEINRKDANASIKDNMYLELYSAENMLITRAKVYLGNAPTSTPFTIKSYVPENAQTLSSKIAVVEKNENDYTYVELNTGADGYQKLTCNRNRHELVYTFKDYYLTSFEERYSSIKGTDIDKYTAELAEYQRFNLQLKAIEGISSELVSSDTGFTITNIFDLSTASLVTLNEYAYFSSSTLARKVNFEMESMGYTCS